MKNKAKEIVASNDLNKVIDFGCEQNRMMKEIEAELRDYVKPFLRTAALPLAASTSDRTVTLKGTVGVVSVTFKDPVAKVATKKIKGQEVPIDLMSTAKPILPPDVYADLFVERVQAVPAPDFVEKFARLTEPQKRLVAKFCEVVPQTPQVTLK